MEERIPPVVLQNVAELAEYVRDGDTLVVPADYGGAPAEAARALVRKGARNLRLIGGPPSGYVADLLIGAGCVSYLEMPGVILGDFGLAPRFRAWASAGRMEVRDTTCPAFHSSIAAAQKGLPFMPMRGLIGSDILKYRPEWQVIANPYADGGDPIVLLPALQPDVVLFHGLYGDRHGNVWVGKAFEVMAMAQAAKRVIATFENFYEGDLLEDKHLAPSTVSQLYTTATVHVERGAWPVAFGSEYPFDAPHMTRYAAMARTEEGFAAYLDEFVFEKKSRAAA
ncbi:CoA transferase subunit A [Xenophilus azovorans]|jgi:glutaconate CoA-transferase subunit A|uniref:CoA transferase subunit A n=1 Tax=Xenophilus TaxID=151754 RepID=UPI000689872A|nr:CoA-transferase [Xenophilus azovorans]